MLFVSCQTTGRLAMHLRVRELLYARVGKETVMSKLRVPLRCGAVVGILEPDEGQ